MKQRNFLRSFFIIFFVVINSLYTNAQGLDKIMFVKSVPVVMKVQDSYVFKVGYVATANRDISIELGGGPSKYWAGKTIKVNKGQGVKEIVLSPENLPDFGAGYRLTLSIKPAGGDWRTTIAARVINNIEFVKKSVPFVDDASFSLATPTVFESSPVHNFDIEYNVSKEQFVQVSIWNESEWLATSKKVKINAGMGTKKVSISLDPLKEGDKYKFVLTFGTQEAFDNKSYAQKEISGVQITKVLKRLTIREIDEKSIQVSLNKSSDILTLPGKSSFESIRIIALNGKTLLEVNNSNKITIASLPRGAYFAITSDNDYYKFVKF
ncbi:hypothetical protein [Lutibacter citreus]|uniref:hypothetical protein n=1 Tax=Lutibacter citreus TaxID=2138210 RepID=UPI000DBE4CF0|nr:hypothetical protein [Lutibacter citreus]